MSPQTQSSNPGKDFESVELGELDKRGEQQREKAPRRIIHFSSGETMEEYSTDEEEGEDREAERKDLLASPVDAVRVRKGWGIRPRGGTRSQMRRGGGVMEEKGICVFCKLLK